MKKLWLIPIMALLTILMAGIGYGALAIDEPDTNDYVKGTTYIINGTPWVGDATDGNCTNITLDYRVSGGSTYTYIGANITDIANITANWVVIFDTTALKDDTTYSVRARCINATNKVVLKTATEVTFKVDNTVPVITTPSPADLAKDTDGKIDFSVTCTNSSSATLHIEGTTYTMTESSDSCTKTETIPTNGFHSWYVIASDGLNSTTSSTVQVEVRIPGTMTPQMREERLAEEARAKPVGDFKSFVKSFFDAIFSLLDRIFKRG